MKARARDRRRLGLAGAICGLVALALLPAAARAAGDENEASCPASTESSPGFRTSLPDCRAYEQVTPPFKDGYEPTTPIYRAANGSSLIAEAYGVFAGTEDDDTSEETFGAVYQFIRTSTGWESEALDPSASLYPSSGGVSLIAAASDLGRTLWVLSGNDDGTEAVVYAREQGGGLSELGPLQAPGALSERLPSFAGASADLSQSLFSVAPSHEEVNGTAPRRAYWPGDGTIVTRPSLYDYSDTGPQPEPKLVGVLNDGPLKSNREAQQISQCGSALGGIQPTRLGAHGDVYNAVSASGETIFFTVAAGGCENETGSETGAGPATDELYARVGGEYTVDLSEPVLPGGAGGECSSGEPCDGAIPEPGLFRGASASGELVFLQSEQPLVNGAPAPGAGMDLYEERLEGDRLAEVRYIANLGIGEGLEEPGVARVSQTGERVYFVAAPKLAGAAPREGVQPIQGRYNLYVYDTVDGALSFVATLSEFDEKDWSGEDVRPVQSSADGEFLVFPSEEDLTPDDTSYETPQLFEYDAAAGTLVRVSRGQVSAEYPGGYHEDGNVSTVPYPSPLEPVLSAPIYATADNPAEAASSLDLTEDGTVVFESAQELTPGAVEEQQIGEAGTTKLYAENVYEYRDGNVYLISNVESAPSLGQEAKTAAIGIDASGSDIFFSTADSLVPQDGDTQGDFYDARTDGGFPAPAPVPGCGEEASCQGLGPVQPAFPPVASASQAPGGNLPSAPAPKGHAAAIDAGFSVGALTSGQRRLLARSGHIDLTVRTHIAGRIVVRASARIAGRRKVVGRATRTLAGGGTAHIRVGLSPVARRALLRSGKLRLTFGVSFSKARGITHAVTAVLRRPRALRRRKTASARRGGRR